MNAETTTVGANESAVSTGRRRWRGVWLAVVVGIVLGGLGGVLGYTLVRPTWSSTGIIHIRPWTSPVVRPSELTGELRSYQSYVSAQMAVLRSQDVIDAALKSPEWVKCKRPVESDEAWQDFLGSLHASFSGDEMVRVTFTDPDKVACVAAVTGVIKAYNERYLDKERADQERNQHTLEDFRDTFERERNDKRTRIHQIALLHGTDDLRPIHQDMQIRLNQKRSERDRIVYKLKLADRSAMSSAPRAMSATMPSTRLGIQGKTVAGEPVAARKLGRDMTVRDIALVDQRMRQLHDEYQDADMRINDLLDGKGESHPLVRESRSSQRARWQAMERYAEQWRQTSANTWFGGDEVGADPVATFVQQLKEAKQEYDEEILALEKQIKEIGLPMLEIERLRSEEREKDRQLAEVVARLETFRTESKATPRVTIMSLGDRPVLKDHRSFISSVGAACGLLLGMSLVAIFRIFRRVLR